jgi:hypothetical protein
MYFIGQVVDQSQASKKPVDSFVIPRYQNLRTLATTHQLEAAKLMKNGNYREATILLDKAIMLLNTVPAKHRYEMKHWLQYVSFLYNR